MRQWVGTNDFILFGNENGKCVTSQNYLCHIASLFQPHPMSCLLQRVQHLIRGRAKSGTNSMLSYSYLILSYSYCYLMLSHLILGISCQHDISRFWNYGEIKLNAIPIVPQHPITVGGGAGREHHPNATLWPLLRSYRTSEPKTRHQVAQVIFWGQLNTV